MSMSCFVSVLVSYWRFSSGRGHGLSTEFSDQERSLCDRSTWDWQRFYDAINRARHFGLIRTAGDRGQSTYWSYPWTSGDASFA